MPPFRTVYTIRHECQLGKAQLLCVAMLIKSNCIDFFNWITISNESNILSAFENDLSLQKGPIIHPANSTNGKLQNVFDRLLLLKIAFILWLCISIQFTC